MAEFEPSTVFEALASSFTQLRFSRSRASPMVPGLPGYRAGPGGALPEPFGQWLQHRLGRAEWDRPKSLEVTRRADLSSRQQGAEYRTVVDLAVSAEARPVVSELAEELSRMLETGIRCGPTLPGELARLAREPAEVFFE